MGCLLGDAVQPYTGAWWAEVVKKRRQAVIVVVGIVVPTEDAVELFNDPAIVVFVVLLVKLATVVADMACCSLVMSIDFCAIDERPSLEQYLCNCGHVNADKVVVCSSVMVAAQDITLCC